MLYTDLLASAIGEILLVSDGEALCGLYFEGQKYVPALPEAKKEPSLPVFQSARAWLARYFAGEKPETDLPLRAAGTDFQRAVWALLSEIPYGATVTYGELADTLSARRGRPCSARAVGAAVGRNPISVIVPCHRVLGAGGALTGYAGGLARKRALLRLERGAL
ncbi:MAG: methylated-DNA--[protein]-cysteine S-methyltransferase [Eubacteriales bacterium]|nr:methylated-DNA--[protein]-cysteine S-methyltransferase [Eubacteriales bacterium]